MNRELVISNCKDCPYFDYIYTDYAEECTLLKRKIDKFIKDQDYIFPIPEDCPLPKTDKPTTEF